MCVLGIVPSGCALASKDFHRAYKRFALVHHPDKGGDTEFFKSVRERFGRVAETLAEMQVELVASWQPFWDNCQCTFGWRDEESGRHAWTEEELPDDAFEQTEEERLIAEQRFSLVARLLERQRAFAVP